MRYLDLSLPTAEENLALDEALLEEAEVSSAATETLRLWEPDRPMVVLGRSSKIDREVRRDVCHEADIPVLRRVSGGATIVTGPGCLMYGLVLSYERRPLLRSLERAHHFVLGTIAAALGTTAAGVRCQGTSDLAIEQMKFSGNSVRCKRSHLLYHGTLLYDFPLELIDRLLRMPPRQPAYRDGRNHGEFVTNLPLSSEAIRRALVAAWDATEPLVQWPRERTAQLVTKKYAQPEWNENS